MLMNEVSIAVIGQGYVGLPLAVEFGKYYQTYGFDIKSERILELQAGNDITNEISHEQIINSDNLNFTSNLDELRECNVYIVTVPTPIDYLNNPDLRHLKNASEMLGGLMSKGDVVIFESTVYPGATEDDCIPIVERVSGLKYNQDFFAGYSPERINPGDKERGLTDIKKITSGSTENIAKFVDELYSTIITAGTHLAPSIRVAEAAKVIENTQRDLNIALVNELAIIFNKLDIDTLDVLEAAGTKWNFLPFRPGLVGGHCIGVDPYYLTHKSEASGIMPDVILSGRRINNGMGVYVASQLLEAMLDRDIPIKDSRVLILGFTFKENCPDIRNTRVIDVISELKANGMASEVFDPWCDRELAHAEYGIEICDEPKSLHYDAIILAVAHSHFHDLGIRKLRSYGKPNHIIYDLKYVFDRSDVDLRL